MSGSQSTARRSAGVLPLWSAGLGVLLGLLMIATNAYGATAASAPNAAITHAGLPTDRNSMGDPAAPIEIVVYNDFQCVYCDRLRTGAEVDIVEQYVRAGLAHLVVRQYPTYGEESLRAAEAALAAADQGKFWEYRDLLYQNRQGVNRGTFADENLIRWAGELGLDQAAFAAALSSGAHRAEVEGDLAAAETLGVSSVPTVFINGHMLEGAQPFVVYREIIEEELAR